MKTLKKLDESLGLIFADGGRIMFVGFASLALFICIAYQFLAVSFAYTLDYGEGPLVDQAMRLAAGQNIYRADLSTPPYTISNYPPLYVAVLAVSVKLFGSASTFFVGRLVSTISAWAACLCLFYLVSRITRDRFAGFAAALIFLAFPYVTFWSTLLRIDMLALALSLGALCLLVDWPLAPRRLLVAGLLLLAAIYTRQSYALAAPFAALAWLVAKDWKRAFGFAALVGGLAVTLFFIINSLTHGGFFFNIVTANVNDFTWERLNYNWTQLRDATLLILIVGGASLILIPRWNPLWMLAAPYLVGATLSAATIGKIGSNVNYLLELCAALSLAAGAVIVWSRAHTSIHAVRALVLIVLALGIGQMMHTTRNNFVGELRDRRANLSEIDKLSTYIANTEGDILIDEYMGMLPLHDRNLSLQPFEVTQLAWAGKWDQAPLITSIEKREYAAIIIYDKPWKTERWTQEMFDAIEKSYRLADTIAGNDIYVSNVRVTSKISSCKGAPWRLPSDSTLVVQWREGGLDFFGQGNEGQIPVYAVADGLLTRRPDWFGMVAIQQDDPLQPGKKIWIVYRDMGAANGIDSYIAPVFPPGSEAIPVKAGDLLGYQGVWSGRAQWPMWVHVNIALVSTLDLATVSAGLSSADTQDPAPYFNLELTPSALTQILKCGKP